MHYFSLMLHGTLSSCSVNYRLGVVHVPIRTSLLEVHRLLSIVYTLYTHVHRARASPQRHLHPYTVIVAFVDPHPIHISAEPFPTSISRHLTPETRNVPSKTRSLSVNLQLVSVMLSIGLQGV